VIASWSSAAHGCSQVAVGKLDEPMAARFVMVEPAGGGHIYLEGIKRPCGRSCPQAVLMCHALGGPEQL